MSNPTHPTANKWAAHTNEVRIFGAIAAALLLASQLIPNAALSAIALLGAAWTGWMFFFGTSGLIASKLEGFSKKLFQIVVTTVFPSVASLY